MTKNKIVDKLKNIGVFIKGSFVLHSGNMTSYYIDIKKSYGEPKLFGELADLLIKKISKNATCVASTGHGGIPLASIVSVKSGLPLVLIRETERDHGTMSTIEGYIPTSKDSVAIIDDVYTTGSSAREMSLAINEYTKNIVGIYVVVWRGTGKPPKELSYLFSQDDFLK